MARYGRNYNNFEYGNRGCGNNACFEEWNNDCFEGCFNTEWESYGLNEDWNNCGFETNCFNDEWNNSRYNGRFNNNWEFNNNYVRRNNWKY